MKNCNILIDLWELTKQDKGLTIIKSRDEEIYISYKTLWERSAFVFRKLKDIGAKQKDEVLIRCDELDQFMVAYWACVMGGFIAIPLEKARSEYGAEVIDKILSKLSEPYLLHSAGEEGILSENQKYKKLDVSKMDFDQLGKPLSLEEIGIPSSDDIVHIQFSSGSTGEPKGVEIRHYNLTANVTSAIEHYEITKDDMVLSWQPLTHCYGLTMYHLLSIVMGIDQYLIPTDIFIQNPMLWMEKTDEHRITRLGSIPFALEHFLNVYKNSSDKKNWDLSCVKSMTVGGEQVGEDLVEKFLEVLKEQNLVNCNVLPVYGLSETTTVVSAASLKMDVRSYNILNEELEIGASLDLMSSKKLKGISFLEMGTPFSTIEVRILDDDDNVLPEQTLGYISVRGASVCSGYYRDREATDKLFSKDNWLYTGDVGFMINDRLVVVGREKELVILNGKKYSCIKIENHIKNNITDPCLVRAVIGNGIVKGSDAERVLVFVETTLQVEQELEHIIRLSQNIKKVVYESSALIVEEVIPVDKIPRTYSGKIRRRYLMNLFNQGHYNILIDQLNRNPDKIKKETEFELSMTKNEIISIIVEKVQNLLHIGVLDYSHTFKECGIVSINIPTFVKELEKAFEMSISAPVIFNYPTIDQLATYIYHSKHNREETILNHMDTEKKNEDDKIAIVGMSCRFPGGANDVNKFWKVLIDGVDGVVDIPESRWESKKYYNGDGAVPGKMYCNKSGFLDTPIHEFDARFFNISPKEVMAMDPQQRLILELTWEAFENACLDITKYSGSDTGVYLGISSNEYMLSHLYGGDFKEIDAYSLTGTAFSVACGRISYTFGFEGPSFAVDTACSSGLTAVHLACNSLKTGETNMAVVAGVNLLLSPNTSVGFTKLSATSPDGHSKAFDASADGYGRAEGGGVILLKKLSDAIQDQDDILGVICGSGINQDGKSNGLTAPNGTSQANLIRRTLKRSNLGPLDIDYMEMHGTGTKLGDPIEVNAVAETYGESRSMENPLRIGSVKSNIGHLEPASGLSSIIKVLLSMKHDLIPANLNFKEPNPLIDWEKIPIRVLDKPYKWEKKDGLRRAAISGFGFGGSNAHILIEEYKTDKIEPPAHSLISEGLNYLLKISAKSEKSLREYVLKYIKQIEGYDENEFIDLLYSANRSRVDFEYRLAVTSNTKEDMVYKLKSFLAGSGPEELYCNVDDKKSLVKNRKVVFMFTGQGSQYVNMGKSLFESNEVFKSAMLSCDKLIKPYILKSIVELLYGDQAANEVIEKTSYAQPLIFSIEYALCKMWESYGVTPSIVMGHSIGEYAAAVIAGMFSLEDAMKLVLIRGRIMDSAPGNGSMGTIFSDEKIVEAFIRETNSSVSIAALNAKEVCVISGDIKEVEAILSLAEEKGIRVRKLKVSHGFHSSLMEPVLSDFMEIAKDVEYSTAKIPFVSALYAREISSSEILDASYWTNHIRNKVDFYHSVLSIEKKEEYIFLEIGANRVLSALCKLILDQDAIIGGTLSAKKKDGQQLGETIAMLYASGVNINWNQIQCMGREKWNKIEIPTYPYDKSVYWKKLKFEHNGQDDFSNMNYDPLLGQQINSPLMKDSIIFQRVYKADEPFFMGEHIIFKTAISPAAAHVSILLSAIKKVKNPVSCTLKSVELRIPLAVPDGEERIVQICLSNIEDRNMNFQITSRDASSMDASWLLHAQGEIITHDHYIDDDVRADIDEFRNRKEDDVTPEEGVYAMMKSGGFELGTGFRRIVKSSCNKGESICTVEASDDIPDLEMYEVYPGVMDCILQTQLCVLVDELGTTNDGKNEHAKRTVIPYYLGSVTYNYKKSKNLWIHGHSNVSDGVVYSDLTAYNKEGEVIIKMNDTMANLTDRNGLLREIKNGFNGIFYHTTWLESKRDEAERLITGLNQYYVIADTQSDGESLKVKLEKENIQVKGLLYGEYEEQLKQVLKELANRVGNEKVEFIYSKGFYSESKPLDKDCLEHLFELVKSMEKAGVSEKIKLKILTRNVHNLNKKEKQNLCQAPLCGFSKVLSIEYPQIFDGIVDTDIEGLETGKAISELIGSSSEEVCLYGGKRYISRLMKHSDYAKKQKYKLDPIVVKPEYSYLITGGTGALGMTYAEFLVNQGVRNLILMCRRKPGEGILARIDEFKKKKVSVELLYADVCNKTSVQDGLLEIQKRVPKIEGVIHAAGSINDKFISDLEWSDFAEVVDPKTDGALHVYQALNEKPEYFIMLSSITSVIGNPGQSNYAAANYFMNRFAEVLQEDGVNGYTMCWGPWKASGMASDSDAIHKNMSAKGIKAFSAETALQIIGQFFSQPSNNLMILDIAWEKMSRNIMGNWQKEFLSNILSAFAQNEVQALPEKLITEAMQGMNSDEQKEFLLKNLQESFGKIMGFGNGQFPASDVGLREQGADSLMIFSMRNIVTKLLGVGIEVSAFFSHPTLIELTDYIMDELLSFGENADKEEVIEESTEDVMSELERLID